ncbi:hypothetical protein [Methanothrix soehngenii]|uniref:hypothetical protein n=1 Tax=Methanothrix soehngenii TaxID=2223 RepID=UPI002FE24A78
MMHLPKKLSDGVRLLPRQSPADAGDKGVAGGVNVMHCDPFSPSSHPTPLIPGPARGCRS